MAASPSDRIGVSSRWILGTDVYSVSVGINAYVLIFFLMPLDLDLGQTAAFIYINFGNMEQDDREISELSTFKILRINPPFLSPKELELRHYKALSHSRFYPKHQQCAIDGHGMIHDYRTKTPKRTLSDLYEASHSNSAEISSSLLVCIGDIGLE